MIGNTEQSYGITYKDISGLLDTYTTPHNSFTYSYDNFDRLTRKLGDKHSIQYTYVNGSQRVNTYTISQATAQQTVYAYTYDNLGNITSVKKNGTTISNYEYDKLGRLIREDDCASNVCWVYAYDKAGNLLNKYEFPGTGPNVAHWMGTYPSIGEIVSTYTYSTSEWGDLLTNYNGTTITYDAIGNPLKWNNIMYMGWEGRNLVSLTEDMLNHGVFFEYNADGIRTKKTLADYDGTTTTHDYILDGSTILKETIKNGNTTTTLYYYYDESGISGISYNGTKYSYVRNLQGDVIAILNSYGGTAVEYKYDAWGNILSVTGALASTLGAVNPFRYRGYYYDTETGFYYLNSRYYDPQVGRFLNADGIIGANGDIMGYNMFAYCINAPVMLVDPNGDSWLPFDKLRYVGEIHRQVLLDIEDEYGYQIEIYIEEYGWRIDVIDDEGRIYEVKPCTWRSPQMRFAALTQLFSYAVASECEWGQKLITGSFVYENFIVSYWSEGALIFYNFQEIKEEKESKALSSSSINISETAPSLDADNAQVLGGAIMGGAIIGGAIIGGATIGGLIRGGIGGPFGVTVEAF